MTPRLLPVALLCSLLLLCVPGSAAAAPWTCEASVVRGTLGPAPAIEPVTAIRRVSCGGARVVKRFKPRRNGTFRVTLQGANRRQVATFRFRTKVRFRAGNPRLFRTYTRPTYVDIG